MSNLVIVLTPLRHLSNPLLDAGEIIDSECNGCLNRSESVRRVPLDKRDTSFNRTLPTVSPLGKPREIVSPRVVQVIVQKDGRKQAELERPAGLKLLNDLPWAEV